MRTRLRVRLAGGFLRLVAGALTGLGGATLAWAQTQPPPAPAARPARLVDVIETPGRSQVFPDGGFASTWMARQPAPAAQPTKPAIPTEPASPSQVFPDGGFPTVPAAEGGIPGAPAQPGLGALFAPLP